MPPVNPTSEPTERSIFADTMTSTIPMAKMPVIQLYRARLLKFRAVRKVPPMAISKHNQMMASANSMAEARRLSLMIFWKLFLFIFTISSWWQGAGPAGDGPS